ncbi:MAG: hypothetical protein L0170_00615 [Acidobacteria bacterium]|nr:hypothetical protein [Acidobacteriota bacterium]
MIPGAVGMALAHGAAILGAWALFNRVRDVPESCRLLVFLTLHLTMISLVIVSAGMLGILSSMPLGTCALAALLLLVLFRNRLGLTLRSCRVSFTWLGAASLLLVARFLIQSWFFAPSNGDALGYHLPKIAEWIRASRFTIQMGPDTHSTFPAGFELVETWWVLFLKHDVLIELAGLEFLVLGAAATYAIADSLGLSRKAATWSALLYVLTPGFYLQAVTCLNDAPVAALLLSCVALVLRKEPPLGILACAIGLGCGVKASFIYALPGIAVLAYLFRSRSRPGRPGGLQCKRSSLG